MPPPDAVLSLLDQVNEEPAGGAPEADPVLSALDQVAATQIPSREALDALAPQLWRRILQEKGAYQGAQARALIDGGQGGPEPAGPASQFATSPLWDLASEDQVRDVLYQQHGYPSVMPSRGVGSSFTSGLSSAADQLWTELRNVSGNADVTRQPGDIAREQQQDAANYAPPTLAEEVASGVGASLPTVAAVAASRGRFAGRYLPPGSPTAVPAEVGATTLAQNVSDPNQTPAEAIVNAALEAVATRAGGAFEPGFHTPVSKLPAEIGKETIEEAATNAAQDIASQSLGKDSDKPYSGADTLHQAIVGGLAGAAMAGGMAVPAEAVEQLRHRLTEAQLQRALSAIDPTAATQTDLAPVETPDAGAALPVDPQVAAALAARGVPAADIQRMTARQAAVEARPEPAPGELAGLQGSDGDIVALANQIRAEQGAEPVDEATGVALPPIDTSAADTAVAAEPAGAANYFDSEDQGKAPIADWFAKLAAEDAIPSADGRQTTGSEVPDQPTQSTRMLDTLRKYHDFVASLAPDEKASIADALVQLNGGKGDPAGALGNLQQILQFRKQSAARRAAPPKENGHATQVRSDQAHPDVPRNPGEAGQDQGRAGVQREAPAGGTPGEPLREVNQGLQRGGFVTSQQAAERARAPAVDRNAETRRMTPLEGRHAVSPTVPGQVVPPGGVAPAAHPADHAASSALVAPAGAAAQPAEPAPSPAARRRARVPEPAGGADVLNAIDRAGGISVRPKGYQGGEYDDQPPLRGIYSRILTRTGGQIPDQVARTLHAQGIGDGTVNTLWRMVHQAVQARTAAPEPAAPEVPPKPVEPDPRSAAEIAQAEESAGYSAPFRIGAGERAQAVPRASIERLLGRYGTVTVVPGGLQITGRGGARILVRSTDRAANGGAVGQFTVELKDGTPIGMIDLVRGRADLHTLSHELVHAFKAMGLITSKEWGALVRRIATKERVADIRVRYAAHGVELSQAAAEEEAVAEWIEGRGGEQRSTSFWQKLQLWARRVASALGLVSRSAHDIAADVAAGKPLERAPSTPAPSEPRSSMLPPDKDPALLNQQSIFDEPPAPAAAAAPDGITAGAAPARTGDYRDDINRGKAKREPGQQGLFDEEATGTTGQQLLFSIPPEKRATAFQTVQSPTGSHDFGDVTADIAKAGSVPAAPIRLLRGHDTGQGNGFGLEHIQARRSALLKRLGLTAQEFVQSVVGDLRSTRITAPGGNVLEVTKGDRKVVLAYFPKPTPYYSVLTAVDQPASVQGKGRVVWSGREAPQPGPRPASPPPKPFAADDAEGSGRTPIGDQTDTKHPPGDQPGKSDGVDSTPPRFSIPAGPLWRFKSADIVANDPKFPAKAPGDTVLAYLRNRGVNDRELYWTGLDTLAGQKGVTKEQVQALLAQPKVQLGEVLHEKGDLTEVKDAEERYDRAVDVLMLTAEDIGMSQIDRGNLTHGIRMGRITAENSHRALAEPIRHYQEAMDAVEQAKAKLNPPSKFDPYTLAGGENYRELLITLPEKDVTEPPPLVGHIEQIPSNGLFRYNAGAGMISVHRTRAEAEAAQLRTSENVHPVHTRDRVNFRSNHWHENNVLLHTRFNERVDADGKRVLHIEEIQSDWHQKGRDQGYREENAQKLATIERRISELDGMARTITLDQREEWADLMNQRNTLLHHSGVPAAPFAKTWEEIGMKRMIRYAAEHGFERVTWTTGEQQAERYDLAKQVSTMRWEPKERRLEITGTNGGQILDESDVTDQRLVELIGKDAAARLVQAPLFNSGTGSGNKVHVLDGAGLSVGGEGMKAAYDQRLVKIARDIGKKFGVAPGQTKISTGEPIPASDSWTMIDSSSNPTAGKGLVPVHSLDITPAMRADALQGQTLAFSIPLPGSEEWALSDKEAEERFQRAHGIDKDSLLRRVKEWGGNLVKQFQRHFEHLDPTKDAQAIAILRGFESGMNASPTIAWKRMLGWVRGMSPKDMRLFERALILPDLVKDIEEGLYDDRPGSIPFYGKGDEDPRGINEVRSLITADAARIDGLLTPALHKRIEDRQAFQRAFAQELVDAGLMRPEILEDSRYYHRQVMKYANAPKLPGLRGNDVRNHTRGAQRARGGGGDFNTLYVESEFEYLSQMMQELAKVEVLAKLKGEFDIKGQLQSEAKARNAQAMTEWHEAQLEHMGGAHDLEGKPWDQAFRQRIASNTEQLVKIAKEGHWPKGPFDDLVQRLAAGEATTDDPDWFPFLAWVAEGKRMVMMPGERGAGERMAQPEIHARAIFRAIGDREQMVKDTLGKKYQTWQKVAAEHGADYTIWQPEEGQQIVPGWSVADHAITQALQAAGVPVDEVAEAALPEVVAVPGRSVKRSLLVMGPKPQWVIPTQLAQQLESMRSMVDMPAWIRGSEWLARQWKRIILLNPLRVVKYTMNNVVGDLDVALTHPGLLKEVPAAAHELWGWVHDRAQPPEVAARLEQATKAGIIDSGLSVAELPDISRQDAVRLMNHGDDALWKRLVVGTAKVAVGQNTLVHKLQVWRESVLRLAAARYFYRQVAAGRKPLGASNRDEVAQLYAARDAKTGAESKAVTAELAAKLARDLLGDYGGLSVAGQHLRRTLIPFWSWMEINAPRYLRLIQNARYEGGPAAGARAAAGVALVNTGKLVVAAGALTAAVALWNAGMKALLGVRDDEDPNKDLSKQFIVIGRRGDGTLITVKTNGALADALGWLDLGNSQEKVERLVQAYRDGQLLDQARATAADVAVAPVNKLVAGITPIIKAPAESLMGKVAYPDIRNPRPIRNQADYWAGTFGMGPAYRAATDRADPVAAATGTALTEINPGQSSYFTARQLVRQYLEAQGKEIPSGEPTARSNDLFEARQALARGEKDRAERWLGTYFDAGGTPKGLRLSLIAADPKHGLKNQATLDAFLGSLSPDDRRQYDAGVAYYSDHLGRGGELLGLAVKVWEKKHPEDAR